MNFDQQNIINILGIEALPEERKIAILNQMTSLLEKRLMAKLINHLTEEDLEQFAGILEKNNPTETQEFIANHFPEFNSWIEQEVNNLKKELAEYQKSI